MYLFIATDYPVYIADGLYLVQDKFSTILKRYYEAFGSITLCSRFINDIPPSNYIDVSDFIRAIVSIDLPTSLFALDNNKIKKGIIPCDLVVGRFDSIVACRAAMIAHRLGKPFFAEIMADAWDGYWNHGIKGKLLAPYMLFANKRAIRNADFALYVTQFFLQDRYPCKGICEHASNVFIPELDEHILQERLLRIKNMDIKSITMATTANVDVPAKGQQYVIKALPKLKEKGVVVKYFLLGGGDSHYLKQIAQNCGVEDQVVFCGEKSLHDVLVFLDSIDIYIQPSLQEGLPRAIIEAMSRALPCLGSTTAGIPELLPEDCLFERRAVNGIVNTVLGVLSINNLEYLARYSFNTSKDYTDKILSERRNAFYNKIKEAIKA